MSTMTELNLIQGSDEWHEARLRAWNASEAPVMMGCHPNMRRDELLEVKATCNPKQYSEFVEKRVFAKGHEVEAKARPIFEAEIGEELFPVSGKNGRLQASFDGLTMMQEIGFEHKQWNADLADQVFKGNPPPYIYWQLEHQLAVCPTLDAIYLVVSDGTPANWVEMKYTAVPGRREQLLAGWEQFQTDMDNWKAAEKKVDAVGSRPDSLPALFVEVAGTLTTSSNLEAFRAGAQTLIGSIKTELVTDQDFADADQAIKWLSEAEGKIDAAIESALARTGPLEELVRTLRDVQENLMRKTRLKLNKQVEAQKVNRRNQIVADAEKQFGDFLNGINAEFAPAGVRITTVRPDFYLAIKGKRSFDMMVSACNDTTAKVKIEANAIADKYRKNLALIAAAKEHDFLFPNKQALVTLDHDHLAMTIKQKVADYEQQQLQSEENRKQGHRNTIAGIKAAGDFDDGVPLSALIVTRARIEKVDTSKLQEFAIEGEREKVASLARLNTRISKLEDDAKRAEELAAEQRRLDASKAAPTVAATQAAAPTATTTAARKARPSDAEIIAAVATHFSVTPAAARSWLAAIDFAKAA